MATPINNILDQRPATHEHVADQTADQTALLRLMQLVSPALPVGAFAYSQGLEFAVDQGWIKNESDTHRWISGVLEASLCHVDVALLSRLYQSWQNQDTAAIAHWNAFLFACRESSELQLEDNQLGRSLARLLADLGLQQAIDWQPNKSCTFANMFSLAAVHWRIPLDQAVTGYLWSWLENQVAAAIKLVPLGQTSGQRILLDISARIPQTAQHGMDLKDDDIGFATPGLAIASALHETQYTRLFRS